MIDFSISLEMDGEYSGGNELGSIERAVSYYNLTESISQV